MTITAMLPQHWKAVKTNYEQGIATGQATFETEAPTWGKWNAGHTEEARLVAILQNEVIGWAALSRISTRKVYAGVGDVSIYISPQARGQGIGKQLLQALIDESEATGFWLLQSSLFPENLASLRLHQGSGFRVVGRRERIGQQNGIWRDTFLLERRSQKTGL
jgi:phosphinothricin acetyltransferase